jgi:thymidylate synthase (FAD)
MNTTNRVISECLEEILGQEFKLLDHGFIRVVDYMGNDSAIVQAARVSYGAGTKKVSEDKGLINYLMRHSHCYHKDTEVLTKRGWLKWSDCNEYETFAVPTTDNKILFEKLKIVSFNYDDELHCFKSSRMSFKVTKEHRMYFKPHEKDKYDIYKIDDMLQFGSFYSIKNYKKEEDSLKSQEFALIGFYLGSGNLETNGSCGFYLKKEKKIHYIKNLLSNLNIKYINKEYEGGACSISFKTPEYIKKHISNLSENKNKDFIGLEDITYDQCVGLFDGLVNSNGSIKKDRSQIDLDSSAPQLLKIFETVGSLLGYDVHSKSSIQTIAYFGLNKALEAQKQYFSKEHYRGKVYCTTSSTGLLLVRGNSNSSGFVCGNSTPFEMCEIKFHVKCPIFVARQWIRHRASSTNEYSARYSIVDNEYYLPDINKVALQSISNKQGRGENADEELAQDLIDNIKSTSEHQYAHYNNMLEKGIAREIARISLTLNYYTEFYWKINLHNLMHFLALRADSHAQYEIRVYALQMLEIMKAWVPYTYDAFLDYKMNATSFSEKMLNIIKRKMNGEEIKQEDSGLSKREWEDFQNKLSF